MLVSGSEILLKAHRENYGVGAFNFVNFEMLNAIFNAALEAKVNDRLKGNTPKSATNKSLEITKEAFKKMSLAKQAEIAKTKPELYKKLTER